MTTKTPAAPSTGLMQIRHRWSNAVLFEGQYESIRVCLIAAIAAGTNLSGSDLRDSNLSGSDLSDSDLSDSDLSGSNLRGSDLSGSNLSGSDLSDSDLSGSDLRGSDLSDSDLSGSDLSDSNLIPIRDDLWAVLSAAPAEAEGLRLALAEGRVDGSTYSGECACLVGTIANVRHVSFDRLDLLKPNSSRPAERFFLAINKGDTPEKSQTCQLAHEWVSEWIDRMRGAFGPKEAAV